MTQVSEVRRQAVMSLRTEFLLPEGVTWPLSL